MAGMHGSVAKQVARSIVTHMFGLMPPVPTYTNDNVSGNVPGGPVVYHCRVYAGYSSWLPGQSVGSFGLSDVHGHPFANCLQGLQANDVSSVRSAINGVLRPAALQGMPPGWQVGTPYDPFLWPHYVSNLPIGGTLHPACMYYDSSLFLAGTPLPPSYSRSGSSIVYHPPIGGQAVRLCLLKNNVRVSEGVFPEQYLQVNLDASRRSFGAHVFLLNLVRGAEPITDATYNFRRQVLQSWSYDIQAKETMHSCGHKTCLNPCHLFHGWNVLNRHHRDMTRDFTLHEDSLPWGQRMCA